MKLVYIICIPLFLFSGKVLRAQKKIAQKDSLPAVNLEQLSIRATRAQPRDGTVYTTIGSKELEKNNLGQDIPFLLENSPSLIATSQAGAGIGYTSIRIRGSDPTRVNVTLNGIPYNDSESLGTYFVDIPDLASSISSIQIQRGVGSSTNGAGAFGGSINIQTSLFKPLPSFSSSNSIGSYHTLKNTVDISSGIIAGHFNMNLRLSRISSNGYIERASSDLKSFFFSAGYMGAKTLLKLNIFSGQEKTYQVFLGVPEDSLATHRRFNPFIYPNQTDNYNQDHFQFFYTRTVDTNLSINLAFHLTHGKGYYEESVTAQAFRDYLLPPVQIGAKTIDTSNLVRRQWLDNYFYGTTFSMLYRLKNLGMFTFGGAYNQYRGQHYGQVIKADYAINIPYDYRYYTFDGFKTDFNGFSKLSAQFKKLTLSGDLQYRRIYYQFLGFDLNKNNTTQAAVLNFFNPKIGFNYALNSRSSVYLSYGIGNKEAGQTDYSSSTPQSRPKPEHLADLEFGYTYTTAVLHVGINVYDMVYRDQLVPTGKINDVGAYINTNVDQSRRQGVEAEWFFKLSNKWRFLGNLSLSSNKITRYDEYLAGDLNQLVVIPHFNTDLAFSPSVSGSATVDFNILNPLHLMLVGKYVGKQYLDNTTNESRKIDRYFVQNVRINYLTTVFKSVELELSFSINNLFSALYVSDGSTSPALTSGRVINNNSYFPQAPINFLGGLILRL